MAKLALYFAVLTIAGRMFRDFSREDSPFRQIHIRRMRWIALLIFLASFINLFSIQLTGWMAALLIWCVSAAVSYTHLDVYKRQVQFSYQPMRFSIRPGRRTPRCV